MADDGDFIDRVKASKAAEKAKEAALAAPPRPQRAKNKTALGNWLETMLTGLVDDVRTAKEGSREVTLNNAALRIGGYVHLGVDRNRAERELFDAARSNGWAREQGDGHVRWKIKRGIDDGIAKPNEHPDLDADAVKLETPGEWTPPKTKDGKVGGEPMAEEGGDRTLRMKRLSAVPSRVPMWVWDYDDEGRIQLGTLTMFAGKPAAGKSTATRWFAARISRGELPGIWHGHPMNVAVISNEEQTDAIVVPGLVAANADLDRVFTPEFRYGDMESSFMAIQDERQLTEELQDNGVRALFVDPVLSTFGGKADIYRNNEVRQYLAPYVRIAQAINGIVVGVTHLTKGQIRDVLGAMNGSSAFGEVPRAVFGFAPTDSGEHVIEQVKNSAGPVGLKLAYQLPVEYATADDGQPLKVVKFDIIGPTEISIADINPNDDETTDIGVAVDWLKMYLLENQPAASAQCKRDAKAHGDIKEWTLKRAMKRLKVVVTSRAQPDKPRTTVWCLPDYYGANQ